MEAEQDADLAQSLAQTFGIWQEVMGDALHARCEEARRQGPCIARGW
jgi:hypothetical protein